MTTIHNLAAMPAFIAYNESAKWTAKSILMSTSNGDMYVNLPSNSFNDNIIEINRLTTVTGAVALSKGKSVFIVGKEAISTKRRAVSLDEFLLKVTSVDTLTHFGLIVHPTATPININDDFAKMVFGMVIVQDSVCTNTDYAYVFESELATTLALTKTALSKALVGAQFNWFRNPAGDYEKAYTLKEVLNFVFLSKSNRTHMGPKMESFIDSVCDLVIAQNSAVIVTNGVCEVSPADPLSIISVQKSSHPNMTTESFNEQKATFVEKTKAISERATQQKEALVKMVSGEDEVSDDNVTDIVIHEAKNYSKKEYQPTLYAQSASCLANYPNRVGDATYFIEHCAGDIVPEGFDNAQALRWNMYWVGQTTKPVCRAAQHRKDANRTGRCKLTELSEYFFIPLHHTALKEDSIITIERTLHQRLRAIDGVWMSNVNGFAIDPELSNANMTELFLVSPDALQAFHKELRAYSIKVGDQCGVIEILRNPNESLNEVISRTCIDRYQGAMMSLVERTATGVCGIVSNMSSSTNHAIGLLDKITTKAFDEASKHSDEIRKTHFDYQCEIKNLHAEAEERVMKERKANESMRKEIEERAESMRKEAEERAESMRKEAEERAESMRKEAEERAEMLRKENEVLKNKLIEHVFAQLKTQF